MIMRGMSETSDVHLDSGKRKKEELLDKQDQLVIKGGVS